MITFDSYQLELADDFVRTASWANIWRLGVVVFTRPEESMCEEVIGPSLQYLHALTGEKVHFYFVGFCDSSGWGYETSVNADFAGDGRKWYFSPTAFADVQTKFENLTRSRWAYSGGTDLLVVPYRIRKHVFYIDAASAIDLKLSRLAHEQHQYMPAELVQVLVRELKQGKDINGVSNSRIMEAVKIGLKNSLTSLLPGGLGDAYRILEPFAVRKLA